MAQSKQVSSAAEIQKIVKREHIDQVVNNLVARSKQRSSAEIQKKRTQIQTQIKE